MFLKFYSHSDEAHAGAERPGQEAGARLGVGAHVVLALVTRQVHLIHNTCPHHHKATWADFSGAGCEGPRSFHIALLSQLIHYQDAFNDKKAIIVKSSRTFVSSCSFLTGPSLSCVGTTSWVATAGGVLCTGPTSEETRCIVAAVRGGDTPSSNGTRYYFQHPPPSLASQCDGKRTFNIPGYYGKIALCM